MGTRPYFKDLSTHIHCHFRSKRRAQWAAARRKNTAPDRKAVMEPGCLAWDGATRFHIWGGRWCWKDTERWGTGPHASLLQICLSPPPPHQAASPCQPSLDGSFHIQKRLLINHNLPHCFVFHKTIPRTVSRVKRSRR